MSPKAAKRPGVSPPTGQLLGITLIMYKNIFDDTFAANQNNFLNLVLCFSDQQLKSLRYENFKSMIVSCVILASIFGIYSLFWGL